MGAQDQLAQAERKVQQAQAAKLGLPVPQEIRDLQVRQVAAGPPARPGQRVLLARKVLLVPVVPKAKLVLPETTG